MSLIVVALGGNALGNSPGEQKVIVKNTAQMLVDIISAGNELVVVHGNGPQVGMINNGFEIAHHSDSKNPVMPFPECGAMSQAYIGYHLQNAIGNELQKRKINKKVATIITQVIVDKDDSAFRNPTKPIGSFYNEKDAKKLALENGFTVKSDANRGWRRVIASPKPQDIVEKDIIKDLIKQGHIVITVGGGGIPVVRAKDGLSGIDGVIDKDFASALLANEINAQKLIILTGVDNVCINFGKPNEIKLSNLSLHDAQTYIDEQQFAIGSMLPKVQAAMNFVKEKSSNIAIIANLNQAKDALSQQAGTIITNKQ